ncbi:MAG: hypothetical protein IJB96_09705 [Lachnospira sp.]|nr:hypothetical protein [Lachnospira sp.]
MGDILVYGGGVLLFLALGISWFKNRPAIARKHEEIPEQVKQMIVAMTPVVFSEDNIKKRYRISWKKLIFVNVLVCVGVCVAHIKLVLRGDDSGIKQMVCLAISLIILCSTIAIAIDSFKLIKMWIKRNFLYSQLGYVHSVLNGHAVISYYDFNREEFVSKQVYLSEDEVKNSKLHTKKLPLVIVVLHVKGDNIKYMALNW